MSMPQAAAQSSDESSTQLDPAVVPILLVQPRRAQRQRVGVVTGGDEYMTHCLTLRLAFDCRPIRALVDDRDCQQQLRPERFLAGDERLAALWVRNCSKRTAGTCYVLAHRAFHRPIHEHKRVLGEGVSIEQPAPGAPGNSWSCSSPFRCTDRRGSEVAQEPRDEVGELSRCLDWDLVTAVDAG
jgi:hypothetical protein